MAQARATFGRSKARTNRARGWEVQGNSLGRRNAQRQRRRAEGQRQFSRQVGTFLAQAPRRGFGGCRAVVKRERRPKTPRRRANGFVGTNTGTILARWRGGAGANPLSLGNAKPRPRREWDNPLASQPDSLARHNKTTLLHTANDASRLTRRIAYRRECDNRTRNTHCPTTNDDRPKPRAGVSRRMPQGD